MAAATRGFRRHRTWTLIAATLAAAILTGCDKQPDNDELAGGLSQRARTRLGGLGRSAATLDCPPWNTVVKATGFDGTDSSEVEACLARDAGGGLVVQVHNRTGVPVTVWRVTVSGFPARLPPDGTAGRHGRYPRARPALQ